MYSNSGCLFLMHISVLVSVGETAASDGGGAEEMVGVVSGVNGYRAFLVAA